MTSWPADTFPSPHDHDTDRRTSSTIHHRFERQNAFIIDSEDHYNPFDPLNMQISDDSSSSSFSSIHSAVSRTLGEGSHTNIIHQEPFGRVPMPQNTADYDEPPWKTANHSPAPPPPIPATTTTIQYLSFAWLDGLYSMLRKALWFLTLSVIYQAFSCTELQHMPTERLYAIDPDAPTHVWVPVFQWTCWNNSWFGQCPPSALWILGATIGLTWLHWKRR